MGLPQSAWSNALFDSLLPQGHVRALNGLSHVSYGVTG